MAANHAEENTVCIFKLCMFSSILFMSLFWPGWFQPSDLLLLWWVQLSVAFCRRSVKGSCVLSLCGLQITNKHSIKGAVSQHCYLARERESWHGFSFLWRRTWLQFSLRDRRPLPRGLSWTELKIAWYFLARVSHAVQVNWCFYFKLIASRKRCHL